MPAAGLRAVLIPEAVYTEIVLDGARKPGAEAIRQAPWITRAVVTDHAFMAQLPRHLHQGEREALRLCRKLPKTGKFMLASH